jgi:chaperone required for assembly of F1-ATPase
VKRLYTRADVVAMEEGFALALDDRPVKTPGRWPLVVPTLALADAIADEWRAQGETIRPRTMPLMQLAATVLDHIGLYRAEVEAATLRYAETDAVCYRAEQPAALVRAQAAAWDPLLDWLEAAFGARLAVVAGILPVKQPSEALATLREVMAGMDDWQLCALQSAAASSGSFVIALSLLEGRLDARRAFEAAEVDASFEIDRWGEDPEATARRATVAVDLDASRRFHDLLG